MQTLRKTCVYIIMLVVPFAAYASRDGGGIGSGRLLPTAAAVLSLIGVVIGIRSRRNVHTKTGAWVASALGLVGVLIGALHAANSAGGFGTGNGLAGAIVSMALGLVSMALGAVSLVRSR